MGFTIIAAVDSQGGIAKKGAIPWHLPEDIAHFRETTTRAAPGKINAVIMGRLSFLALDTRERPLPGRHTFILTRRSRIDPGKHLGVAHSLHDALTKCETPALRIDNVFVAGGADVYTEALQDRRCERVILTRLRGTFDCDRFISLSLLDARFDCVQRTAVEGHGSTQHSIETYARRP